MPSALTYPGVYIEEVPSGVRTISGVSTSVTAFVGAARRGPVNRAVRVQSFAEFERRFGGLDPASEMSYGVRQFFANGGSDAWVVRVAKGADAAELTLNGAGGDPVLKLTARDQGASGNAIQVRVDTSPSSPSAFDLTLTYASPESATENRTESFAGLSMSSRDFRYAVDVVNAGSELVTLERVADLADAVAGTSTSGALVDGDGDLVPMDTLVDAGHRRFRVSVNGLAPVAVTLDPDALDGSEEDQLDALCGQIATQVTSQAAGVQALSGFTCEPDAAGERIVMTSGEAGEASSVRVLPGAVEDASARLKLGALGGGTESDGTAPLVPRATPEPGRLVGAPIADDALPAGGSLEVSLDGEAFRAVSFAIEGEDGEDDEKAADAAAKLQAAVRALKSTPAYAGFTAEVGAGRRITLSSGSRGAGSSVAVRAAGVSTLAGAMGLAGGAATAGADTLLTGGSEQAFTADDPQFYSIFVGSRSQRGGLYALEAVDIFNLLCLPGVSDSGILADAAAYCQERRAFLIADAPRGTDTPAEMVTDASGTAFPKSDHAAVYFPWIRIADPLAGGRLRTVAPSGTMAGVYARTDAQRGVWKAPAGTDAPMVGVQGVTYPLTDAENGQLNPLGVNCIRILPVYGAVPWGTRTLRGADAMASEWKYVPVRRLALYIEESLYRGTQRVVFEPNDEPLWSQIRLNLGAFMNGLFRQGAFQGRSPREAYFVKCDSETTTQADINLGVVNVVVGFAPLKPAEFVVLRIQQMAGQIQT
jgi:phage tail sheath protein FI